MGGLGIGYIAISIALSSQPDLNPPQPNRRTRDRPTLAHPARLPACLRYVDAEHAVAAAAAHLLQGAQRAGVAAWLRLPLLCNLVRVADGRTHSHGADADGQGCQVGVVVYFLHHRYWPPNRGGVVLIWKLEKAR